MREVLTESVNYLAVLVSAIAAMVIGFAWYSPTLFGPAWIRAIGADPGDRTKMDEMKKGMGSGYVMTFIAALLTACVLATFINRIGPGSVMTGLKVAIAAWLGFVATVKLTDVIFSGRPRKQSMAMFWIGTGYQLVSFVVMGLILGYWK